MILNTPKKICAQVSQFITPVAEIENANKTAMFLLVLAAGLDAIVLLSMAFGALFLESYNTVLAIGVGISIHRVREKLTLIFYKTCEGVAAYC